jgi:hypothetical protein
VFGPTLDDTRLPKTGHCIQQAFYQRDPLSPPFWVNLVLGLRFLQASLLVPMYLLVPVSTRGLPIRFREADVFTTPGKSLRSRYVRMWCLSCTGKAVPADALCACW